MTTQTLTTAQELNNAPVGTVIIDPNGYAWQKGSHTKTISGAIRSSWFNAISAESHMSDTLEKDGPYTVIYTPEQAGEPRKPSQREYVTEADVEELNNAPIGTFVADKEVDLWVKAHDGWTSVAEFRAPLHVRYAPYTLIHTPPSDLANL